MIAAASMEHPVRNALTDLTPDEEDDGFAVVVVVEHGSSTLSPVFLKVESVQPLLVVPKSVGRL